MLSTLILAKFPAAVVEVAFVIVSVTAIGVELPEGSGTGLGEKVAVVPVGKAVPINERVVLEALLVPFGVSVIEYVAFEEVP